ncbi:MAG: phosphoribosylamine--glycine ligase [Alphaproteobacteria bacterium]|nr:phosphoribosylamine--glycine ligase [Alphaproteobacteria bacterium]
MNILVIGSGGREHALCWKISQSPLLKKLYCAPGNGGIEEIAECVPFDGLESDAVVEFCEEKAIDLVVIGPEAPLVTGLVDVLRDHGITAFGPDARAAQLEGSKGFAKELCQKYNIPTAAYGRFTDPQAAKEYLMKTGVPIVVKADGLAAGKGVYIAQTMGEAILAVEEIFSGRFGAAGVSIVIEAFLEGEEVSFFALSDGDTAIEFGSAQDHKRVGDGDTGPNTGGMGTYSPSPVVGDRLRKDVMQRIVIPTVQAMKREGMPFRGVLFVGLMLTREGPQVLEYNARFGDPETQVLMRRLESDIVPYLVASAKGTLASLPAPVYRDEAALCVVMAAKGYPGDYVKGTVIHGLADAARVADATVFHAGTKRFKGSIISAGGRVLGVTATGPTVGSAQKKAYEAVDALNWPDGFCRRDIGWRAVAREKAVA